MTTVLDASVLQTKQPRDHVSQGEGCERRVQHPGRTPHARAECYISSVEIRALLFDLGGVWVQEGDFAVRARWASDHQMTRDELDQAFVDSIGPGWEGGRSEHEIHQRLLEACGAGRSELPQLLDVLHAHERLDDRLSEFIADQRASRKIGVITNAGPGARAEMCRRHLVHERSDSIVVSAEWA